MIMAYSSWVNLSEGNKTINKINPLISGNGTRVGGDTISIYIIFDNFPLDKVLSQTKIPVIRTVVVSIYLQRSSYVTTANPFYMDASSWGKKTHRKYFTT